MGWCPEKETFAGERSFAREENSSGAPGGRLKLADTGRRDTGVFQPRDP